MRRVFTQLPRLAQTATAGRDYASPDVNASQSS